MNLYELDKLINSLDIKEDKELIEFYLKKRLELLEQIEININKGLKGVNHAL